MTTNIKTESMRTLFPLYPFQKNAIERMKELDSVLLFDDMGLGKTRQVLETVIGSDEKPALLIPPKGLVTNWYHEIVKWFPEETPILYKGDMELFLRQYFDAKIKGENRLFIIWHDVLSKSPHKYMNNGKTNRRHDEFIEVLYGLDWKAIVIDEAHKFRNDGSLRTTGLKRFKNGKRYVLTGTPTVNSAEDLYPLLDFVKVPELPELHSYLGTFTRPGRFGRPTGFRNRGTLMDMIGDRWIRRTKAQVLRQLPPKIEQRMYVSMEDDQRTIYDALVRELIIEIWNEQEDKLEGRLEIPQGSMMALALLTRLRQLALEPRIFGFNRSSAKTQAILQLLEDHKGIDDFGDPKKAVIYSNFVGYLDILERDLQREGYNTARITGKEDVWDRKINESRFQNNDNCTVLLVSMAAGGEGLNLTAASLAIVADEWWNDVRMKQAIDRSHRIGQRNQLLAITLHCEDSVDDDVNAIVSEKTATSQFVLNSLVENMMKSEEGQELLKALNIPVEETEEVKGGCKYCGSDRHI